MRPTIFGALVLLSACGISEAGTAAAGAGANRSSTKQPSKHDCNSSSSQSDGGKRLLADLKNLTPEELDALLKAARVDSEYPPLERRF